MRHLLATAAMTTWIMVHGQQQICVFTGIQHDHFRYRPQTQDPRLQSRYVTEKTTFDMGSGWGWNFGGWYASSKERTAFKGGVIYSEQRVSSSYSRLYSFHALGGGNSSDTKGVIDEKFKSLEVPLLCSVEIMNDLRVEVGVSPWTLIAVSMCDRSATTGSS